jgi:hypothetical protein
MIFFSKNFSIHLFIKICKSIGFSRGAQYGKMMILNFFILSLLFYQAFTVEILDNATCYPGIICDGTENGFFDCKYDRAHVSNKGSLSAIITRCIGKRTPFEKKIFQSLTVSVDGGFSSWSKWSNCTKPCGTGETTRVRTCTEPLPSIPEPEIKPNDLSLAGTNCTGDYKQVKDCNTQKC